MLKTFSKDKYSWSLINSRNYNKDLNFPSIPPNNNLDL